MECKCIDCPNKCHEYNNNYVSDRAYYEWSIKLDKCRTENKVGWSSLENVFNKIESEEIQ